MLYMRVSIQAYTSDGKKLMYAIHDTDYIVDVYIIVVPQRDNVDHRHCKIGYIYIRR